MNIGSSIQVRQSKKDFLKVSIGAMLLQYLKRPTYLIYLTLPALLVVLFLPTENRPPLHVMIPLVLLGALAWVIFMFAVCAFQMFRLINRNPQLYQDFTVTFEEEGIRWVSADYNVLRRWAHLKWIVAKSQTLFIAIKPQGTCFLPRASFSSDLEYQSWSSAIQKKIDEFNHS